MKRIVPKSVVDLVFVGGSTRYMVYVHDDGTFSVTEYMMKGQTKPLRRLELGNGAKLLYSTSRIFGNETKVFQVYRIGQRTYIREITFYLNESNLVDVSDSFTFELDEMNVDALVASIEYDFEKSVLSYLDNGLEKISIRDGKRKCVMPNIKNYASLPENQVATVVQEKDEEGKDGTVFSFILNSG